MTPSLIQATAGKCPGTVTFLGTGTSVGVPVIGCQCEVCLSGQPRNGRLRCAISVHWQNQTLLVDTPPDLRTQLLREDIRLVNGVLFTHEHADHLFGLDDLRLFPFKLGGPVPLFCAPHVEARIRHTFDYAFDSRDETHPGARPQLVFRSIHDSPFDAIGLSVVPIPMQHGPHFETLGFRFGDFAYCTDTNGIPPTSVARLRGVRTLVLGALRHEPHPTHFTIEQAIAMAQMIAPERTFLTHLSHDIDYETTSRALPPGIHLAFDGLRVNANLDVV